MNLDQMIEAHVNAIIKRENQRREDEIHERLDEEGAHWLLTAAKGEEA